MGLVEVGWEGVIPEKVGWEEVEEAVGAMVVVVLGVGAMGVEQREGEVLEAGILAEAAKAAAHGDVAWTVAV